MSSRIRRTSGFARVAAVALAFAAGLSGCNYSFVSGTGLQGVETMAIVPFENETTRLELSTELYDQMFRELPSKLGLRIAGEEEADVIVRGVISGYTLDSPNYRSGGGVGSRPEVLQRQVSIRIAVQIVDQNRNLILWENTSLQGQGQYLEASESEETGKQEALDRLVEQMINGAQSNW